METGISRPRFRDRKTSNGLALDARSRDLANHSCAPALFLTLRAQRARLDSFCFGMTWRMQWQRQGYYESA
jgi:hypothetical protein